MKLNLARDIPDPSFSLSRADAIEYAKIQESFIHSQNARVRDRRGNSFKNELDTIIRFVDSRPEDRELRALATGLVRTGSYLCVNSQRLKNFVHRCKSSINNGFQQLGFDSVKSRSRSNACLAAALPSIANQSNLGRQWTVRCIEKYNLQPQPTDQSLLPQSFSIERPKSVVPVIRTPLPIPILSSKNPLPVPKIDQLRSNRPISPTFNIPLINNHASIGISENNSKSISTSSTSYNIDCNNENNIFGNYFMNNNNSMGESSIANSINNNMNTNPFFMDINMNEENINDFFPSWDINGGEQDMQMITENPNIDMHPFDETLISSFQEPENEIFPDESLVLRI
ncbi:hypothetical protein TRFO_03596 [Tritrichomonas foetus]|uniref:Initiator binding domain-containing protein n=1 Tax=Tritrichomonas foetus TaxID=1144522 RepID=A0A1J4KN93_9EUKA|nr:hypothetical protein TRFO_03596 [Tritrichomonas foetus]|eukprot:OHT12586.1 hypothetical protein TRFO_03596 [Tritrichomonas foetus]